MEYGNKTFKDDKLFLYQGFYPAKSHGSSGMSLIAQKDQQT